MFSVQGLRVSDLQGIRFGGQCSKSMYQTGPNADISQYAGPVLGYRQTWSFLLPTNGELGSRMITAAAHNGNSLPNQKSIT
jgi:hypothetical protein